MRAAENRQTIRDAFESLTAGDARPFWEALSEDVRWVGIGSTSWSGVFEGKACIERELLAPLRRVLGGRTRLTVDRVLADDDCVVVEARGSGNVTSSGARYDNTYCLVFRFGIDGKVREVVEYADTDLIARALPARSEARREDAAPAG